MAPDRHPFGYSPAVRLVLCGKSARQAGLLPRDQDEFNNQVQEQRQDGGGR